MASESSITWVDVATMIGEFTIAIAIYMEFGGARLDRFYEVASNEESWKQRNEIYKKICSDASLNPESFAKLLATDAKLREDCDRQISLLSMIGEQLPVFPPRKRRVLTWFPHAVVILWYFLAKHVEKRRETGGPNWAIGFETFARACAGHLITEVKEIKVWDPVSGNTVHTISQNELLGLSSRQKRFAFFRRWGCIA